METTLLPTRDDAEPILETHIPPLRLWRRGKVRDVYDLGDRLLIVATDRISAFDVILPTGIPGKGVVLTQLSLYWFRLLSDVVANHVITSDFEEYGHELAPYRTQLEGRSMVVAKTEPLPAECVVRGYITGSGWKDYKQTGAVCGISLPKGLRESERLEPPIFTPSTKAEVGHDENIDFARLEQLLGRERAKQVRDVSLTLYARARPRRFASHPPRGHEVRVRTAGRALDMDRRGAHAGLLAVLAPGRLCTGPLPAQL